MNQLPFDAKIPTLELGIVCQNHSLEKIKTTAMAALALDYPVNKLKVYLLDEQESSELKKIAQEISFEDLHTNQSSQVEKLKQEKSVLIDRLEQIKNITSEVINISNFFQSASLRVDSYPEALMTVLDWFTSLRQPFIPTPIWLQCQTVLGEGFDNVVSHAHEQLLSETPIDLEVEIFKNLIIIKIWDWGSGFDLEDRRQKIAQGVDRYAESGRGVQILERAADYFSYHRHEDQRNCLLIVKFFEPLPEFKINIPKILLNYLSFVPSLMKLFTLRFLFVYDYLTREINILKHKINAKELKLRSLVRCHYISYQENCQSVQSDFKNKMNFLSIQEPRAQDFLVILNGDYLLQQENNNSFVLDLKKLLNCRS